MSAPPSSLPATSAKRRSTPPARPSATRTSAEGQRAREARSGQGGSWLEQHPVRLLARHVQRRHARHVAAAPPAKARARRVAPACLHRQRRVGAAPAPRARRPSPVNSRLSGSQCRPAPALHRQALARLRVERRHLAGGVHRHRQHVPVLLRARSPAAPARPGPAPRARPGGPRAAGPAAADAQLRRRAALEPVARARRPSAQQGPAPAPPPAPRPPSPPAAPPSGAAARGGLAAPLPLRRALHAGLEALEGNLRLEAGLSASGPRSAAPHAAQSAAWAWARAASAAAQLAGVQAAQCPLRLRARSSDPQLLSAQLGEAAPAACARWAPSAPAPRPPLPASSRPRGSAPPPPASPRPPATAAGAPGPASPVACAPPWPSGRAAASRSNQRRQPARSARSWLRQWWVAIFISHVSGEASARKSSRVGEGAGEHVLHRVLGLRRRPSTGSGSAQHAAAVLRVQLAQEGPPVLRWARTWTITLAGPAGSFPSRAAAYRERLQRGVDRRGEGAAGASPCRSRTGGG